MEIHRTKDGKYVAATYLHNKKRYRTTLTEGYIASEAGSVDDLPGVRKYTSKKNVLRAIRNLRGKE